MNTQIFIEGYQLDLSESLGAYITKSVNDVRELNSKNGAYTKTVKLPGTTKNNKILGYILNPTRAQDYNPAQPNVMQNYSAAKPARCMVLSGGLLLIRGVLRLLKINEIRWGVFEYECTIYGEIGGFAGAMGKASNLDNADGNGLDFSAYNFTWNVATMNTYSVANAGTGLYFPLIDYGNVSADKINYQYSTLRPALFVKDIVDKIMDAAGYTYDCPFFESDFFKRLIIPNNADGVYKNVSTLINRTRTGGITNFLNNGVSGGATVTSNQVSVPAGGLQQFTANGSNTEFTYAGSTQLNATLHYGVSGFTIAGTTSGVTIAFEVKVNGVTKATHTIFMNSASLVTHNPFAFDSGLAGITFTLNPGDVIRIAASELTVTTAQFYVEPDQAYLQLDIAGQVTVPAVYGDALLMNDMVPKGVKQKEFITGIMNMFNLYITDDPYDDKKLVIRPYPLFFDTDPATYQDWSRKVDRSTPVSYTPMSEITGRRIHWRYTEDGDYYNELYRNRHSANYGNHSELTGFEFGDGDKEIQVAFAATPLVRLSGTDKTVSTIFNGVPFSAEEATGSKIRILYANKITGVSSWDIKDGTTVLASRTYHPYAGHLDNPATPTLDLNWGAPYEVFYELTNPYPSNNLYTAYWQHMISEITSKDSLLMTCYVRLSRMDFSSLDFGHYIYIDGNLWVLHQVIDYNSEIEGLTKVELLKVINTL